MSNRFALRSLALLTAGALILGGCWPGNRLTKANVAEVTEGMTKKQVESILGAPTSVDTKDLLVLKETTYVYRQRTGVVTIVFKNDKVQSKDSTLAD